jgi:hypothetical protein
MTKIVDLLQGTDPSKPHVSIEFFPPRTEEGVKVRERETMICMTKRSSIVYWSALTLSTTILYLFAEFICSHGPHERHSQASVYGYDLGCRR